MLNVTKNADNDIVISKEEFDKLVAERDDFKRQLDELKRLIYGSKSERYLHLDSNQLSLFEELVAKKEEELEKHTIIYQREKSKKEKQKPIHSAIPAHFPRVEEVIEPDNVDPNAIKIGEEITELLEIKPMTIFVRRIVRPKYALPKGGGVIIAELPSLPIPKGNASSSILSWLYARKG